MLKLHVIQAGLGDCLLLEYKEKEQEASKFILVDGGPNDTYNNHLKAVLREKVGEGGHLDLAVVSHIDNDHICGMLDFLGFLKEDKDGGKPPRTQVDALWHNTVRQNIGIESPKAAEVLKLATEAENLGLPGVPTGTERGFEEGEKITRLAKDLSIAVNPEFGVVPGFTDKVVLSESAPSPLKMGKLKIWILSPDRVHLEKLQDEWSEWLQKNVKEPVRDVKAKESRAPNLSSIILLVEEEGGRKILLPGDGTGEEILKGLNAHIQPDADGRFHFDVLKLPHHGSRANVTPEFFDQVTADVYVISAKDKESSREGDKKPDKDTLEWLVSSAKRQKRTIRILATNDTESILKLKQEGQPVEGLSSADYATV